ncbi:MAG TPA: TMEM175 family protein [Gemmatimonadaceae bacterium]|nr:TMEM175 family protein [Gemmatimonadaceae bacterium]
MMGKGRIEAFSDGVLAIIITIMVLEMKTPADVELSALRPLAPVFVSYVLSFLYLGIYWSNHHHLLYAMRRVSGGIMWANLHLLFWLSLVPFVTRWMGDSGFAKGPTMLYGVILLLCGAAYWLLQRAILRAEGAESTLAKAVGSDWKAPISLVIFVVAILLAFVSPWIAAALYALGVLPWLVPDRRIEREVSRAAREPAAAEDSSA